MHNDFAAVRGVVNSLLRQYVTTAALEAEQADIAVSHFWEHVDSVIQAGGKRLRPYLVVLAYEACGGQNRWPIMPVAAAWEMLHQSLLMHDDLIDGDSWRHGQPNLAGLYQDVYHHLTGQPQVAAAEAVTLIAGDLLHAAAHQLVLTSDIPIVMKPDLAQLLNYAYQATAYGGLLEIEALFKLPQAVAALQIAELKTAQYSFNGPLQTGALLAGASPAVLDQFAEIGQLLGLAYQLTDDLLGVFGSYELTGKSNTQDVQTGKRTRLLQLTYEQLSSANQHQLQYILQQPIISEAEASKIKAYMQSSGAVELVQGEINGCVQQALVLIDQLILVPEAKQRFTECIVSLRQRSF